MAEMQLSIAHEYSKSPAGRYPKDGPFNGERFREELLIPKLDAAISAGAKLVVNFADADSYSSSFLEEAFGGVVREGRFSNDQLKKYLELVTTDPAYDFWVIDAQDYMKKFMK